jgi:nicotinamide mononucleotide transporter
VLGSLLDRLLLAAKPILAPAFTLWGSPVTWLELVAVVLALLMVLANMRVNPIGWPLAIISSLLYALLFANSKLYGEAGLQLIFVVLAFWGWWQWVRGTGARGLPLVVTRMKPYARWSALLLTLLAWPALGLLLNHGTDSDRPFSDALATVASITGQVLLGRKWLETWPVWLMVNLFSVWLFASKALWLTTALYAVFAVLSILGWRAWRLRLPAHA